MQDDRKGLFFTPRFCINSQHLCEDIMGRDLKLENLTKRYGNLTAVDHVNLEIREGEFILFPGAGIRKNNNPPDDYWF